MSEGHGVVRPRGVFWAAHRWGPRSWAGCFPSVWGLWVPPAAVGAEQQGWMETLDAVWKHKTRSEGPSVGVQSHRAVHRVEIILVPVLRSSGAEGPCSVSLAPSPGKGQDGEWAFWSCFLPVNVVYSSINFNCYPMGSSELDGKKKE